VPTSVPKGKTKEGREEEAVLDDAWRQQRTQKVEAKRTPTTTKPATDAGTIKSAT